MKRITPDSTRRQGRKLFDDDATRKLLEMHHEGYSSEYIAVTMNCSVATVFNYLRRNKNK